MSDRTDKGDKNSTTETSTENENKANKNSDKKPHFDTLDNSKHKPKQQQQSHSHATEPSSEKGKQFPGADKSTKPKHPFTSSIEREYEDQDGDNVDESIRKGEASCVQEQNLQTEDVVYFDTVWHGEQRRAYKEEYEIPRVTTEFVLYCPDAVDGCAWMILCDKAIPMKKSSTSDSIYKLNVSVKSDFPKCTYRYEIKKSFLKYATRYAESAQSSEFDINRTHRDFWKKVTADGVLQHINDIAARNLDMTEATHQIEDLPFTRMSIIHQTSLLLEISSQLNNCSQQKRNILAVTLCIFLTIAGHTDLKTVLNEETANILLESLGSLKECYLPGSYSKSIPELCHKLCATCFDETTKNIAELYYCYPFLEEKQCYKNVVAMRKNICGAVNEQTIKLTVGLFMKLYRSKSFGSQTSVDLIKTLVRDLPFGLTVANYKHLLAIKSESDCHEQFKKLIQTETVKRTEQKLKCLGENKLRKFYSLWEHVQDARLDCAPFVAIFEKCLLGLLTLSTLQNVDVVEKIARQAILFATQEKKQELLQAIVSSPNYEISDLFMKLAKLSEIADVYSTLDSSCFEKWYYNSPETPKGTETRKVNEVCRRLLFILKLKNLKERVDIVDIVRGILHDELQKRRLEQVMGIAEGFEKSAEANSLLGRLFLDHISTEIKNSTMDIERLLGPFLCNGVIQLKTRFIADILILIIEKYGNTVESYCDKEQFFTAVDQRRLWTAVFKAEGQNKDSVSEHPFYITTSKCIRMIAEKLSKQEVDFKLMKSITARKDEVADILSSFGEKEEIKELIECNQRKFENEEKRIKAVASILQTAKRQSIELPDNFDQFANAVGKKKADFYGGQIKGSNLHLIWENMEQIPCYCLALETVIQSVVYWNLLRDELANNSSVHDSYMEDSSTAAGDNLSGAEPESDDLMTTYDIRNNETVDLDNEEQESDVITWNKSINYIEYMHSVGLQNYKQHMRLFLEETNLNMSQVLHIFKCKSVYNPTEKHKPDLDVEKALAARVLNITFENSIWDALKQIYSIGKIKPKVEGMRSFLQVIEVDLSTDLTFASALESFEQLLKHNVNEYSFVQVKTSLEMIYSIINTLSDQSFDIMTSIGQCSSLVDFLKETVEEDIRNLIDAVEDLSEQQVCESTVSGLIEIKQLLLPILKSESGENCQTIFKKLECQVKRISRSTSIPAKINDCMENLHNLRSLYYNVANRGEQTKQIVENILDQGHFKFQLTEHDGSLLLDARYEQNDRLVMKKRADLMDLRSRSLLLMNSETKTSGSRHLSKEQVETFVVYVDQSLDLSDLYTLLHTSGHFKYITIDEELKPSILEEERKNLNEEFNDWEKQLQCERDNHYLMNYIHGFGLHSMYKYLNLYGNMSSGDLDNLADIVQTILMFIHPKMKAAELREIYVAEKGKCKSWTNANWLNCLGVALHGSYPVSSTFPDRYIVQHGNESESVKMTDVVEEGKLFLVQLDENSLYTVRTVIALYASTVNRMPESHQVLFCTRETTFDEIDLLIERCLGANIFYGSTPLYCIANVELLPSELYSDFLDRLRNVQEEHSFRLALICRGTNNHRILDELGQFKTTVAPASKTFVNSVFKAQHGTVITLTSDLAGLGKSSRVLQNAHRKRQAVTMLHVSGCSRKAHLIERLNALKVRSFNILHIDIGTVDDPKELDTFLFELLILGYVSVGRVSVALGTEYVYIEIANTINETLRNSLQTAILFSRDHIQWHNFNDFVVSKETHSSVQIACKYFSYLEKGYLDKKDVSLDMSRPLSSNTCRRLLKKYINIKDDMSFPIVSASLDVLADQLKKMTCSPFFRVSHLQDMMGNKPNQTVKSSLVKEMIDSTNEFASRSISSCKDTQLSTIQSRTDSEGTSDTAIKVTQKMNSMIRWEDGNHLMFVFHCQNIQTLSPLYRDRRKVPKNIETLFCNQMNKALQDFKDLSQEQLQDLLQKIARNSPVPLPSSKLKEIASSYALTPDSLLKMALIVLRVKANVPVVIMGETGCGKTSLVRYLASICEVPFDVLNIHSGVTENTIIHKVHSNCLEASKTLNMERWLFLDEINTSECIGVMTEIICHHKCLGKSLPPNLIVMGACNPYKLRSRKDITTAGLTLKSQSDELSRLVYRVLPLPEMMVDYVWDFGSLNENDEKLYVKRMVDGLFPNETFHDLFSEMLSVSQSFVRRKEESAYVVSLRDVNRCRLLTEWFIRVLCKKTPYKAYTFNCDTNIRAMILALAHCYHSRFPNKDMRADYRRVLHAKLREYDIEGFEANDDRIDVLIIEEQTDFISRLELPDGIACNTALMENVFVLIVCIYNRLPVFVVGKPGCSKSLAMQIIRSNFRGKDSKDTFLKTLPQVFCVSFQGSESSTSDGILKVFMKAEKYQSSNNVDDVLSVVILDEIGLAEVSRFNPLKVLHNLLEPDGEERPRVAVVGLSNWSLDASKMNRAIHLSRTDMDEDELYETAKAISKSFATYRKKEPSTERDTVFDIIEYQSGTDNLDVVLDIKDELKRIATSYYNYCKRLRVKNFHGLRDYYALVKYVARKSTTDSRYMASAQQVSEDSVLNVSTIVRHGLERNFGGLPFESNTLYEIFKGYFSFDTQVRRNILDLIAENVEDQSARHLMLISSGDSSLGILEQQLDRIGRNTKEVILGSQFEDDLTDDYNYRILSRIILCMEEGIILILKDLENIYGSLYDMLNQNYTIIGNKKNCRIALGAYSNPICQVANTFRCIVLMDKSKVEVCDPPFLNRFEKQYLRFSDVLDTQQKCLVNRLQTWVKGLTDIHEHSFEYTDVFPIYSADLLPSLVLKTEREHKISGINLSKLCKQKLIWILKPEAVIRLKRAVTSSIAVDADEIQQAYFELPLHRGLKGLISAQLSNVCSQPEKKGILTVVFTNSNMHISLQRCLSYKNVQIEKLGTFKSEKQVSTEIQRFWSKDTQANILIVQCSAIDDEKHIMLTKSIIERNRTTYQSALRERKHVYVIIHTAANRGLSKIVSQINFMSDWNLVMLDSLEAPQTDLPKLCCMDILKTIKNKRPLNKCLMNQLLWSFTRIKYSPFGRDVESIKSILTKIRTSTDFLQFLDEEIWRIISKMKLNESDWQIKVACDMQALRNSSSFVDALEQHIMKVLKIPLTKLIFCMEKNGILDSYFINDSVSNERKKVWINLIHDEKIFSLDKVPDETGPECYSCEAADCSLKMPFSRIIFSRLESQRDKFMEDLSVLKSNFKNEELPQTVYNDLLEKHASYSSPDWKQFRYETCEKDYIHDFSSLLSVNTCSGMSREKRAYIMEWIVLQKTDLSGKTTLGIPICLHTAAWINMSLFRSEMLLFSICEKFGLDKQVLANMMQFGGLQSERISATPEEDRKDTETINDDYEVCGDDNIEKVLPGIKFDSGEFIPDEVKETCLEQVEQTQVSSESFTMNAEDYLVQGICKEMIPTKPIVEFYGGIQSWQRTVNAILVLAAKVSMESNLLFSLRVCNEIAGNLIIPMHLDANTFFELGDILLHFETVELDSKEVFNKIIDIISEGLKGNSSCQTNCYRVFSSYLVRCIQINRESEVLDFLFTYILSNTVPDEMIHHFKAPLNMAVDLESNGIEGSKLLQYFLLEDVSDFRLVSEGENEKHDAAEDESENGNICSYTEHGSFIYAFDSFLKKLDRLDKPFVLIIVDLLADLFESSLQTFVFNDISSDRFRTVYDCHKIITGENYGIRLISALAYVKSFISLLEKQQMWDNENAREYWDAVNVLLSDFRLNQISQTLLTHFVKSVSKGLTVRQVKMNTKKKNEKFEFLDSIVWSNGYTHCCFDDNPFCQVVGQKQHAKLGLCNGSEDLSKVERTLIEFLSSEKSNEVALLNVLTFVFNEYQLTKTETNDEMSLLLARFTCDVGDKKCKWHGVLKFLSGTEDFKCTGLDLEWKSKYLKYNIQSVLLQFFILLLSHNSTEEEMETNIFIRCLTCPVSVKECFLPGFLESFARSEMAGDVLIGLATCNCGSRIAFHFDKIRNDMNCVFCPLSLTYERVILEETEKSTRIEKTVWRFDEMPQGIFTVRGLHPVTTHLLQLLIKSCILGSCAFAYSSEDEVKEVVGDTFEVNYLLEDIKKHWCVLSKLLTLDDYSLSTFLRVIIVESSEYFCKHPLHSWTDTERSEIEQNFEAKIKSILSEGVRPTIHQHNQLHGISDSSFENILSETNDISGMSETERLTALPLLFRVANKPTKDNFISEYLWRKAEFPFLELILNFENQLSLPGHLYSIIQWHVTTVANASYMLKKHECLEMTVQQFFFLNPKKKDLLEKRFNAFQKAWNKLSSFFHKTEIGPEIKHVHTATKLKECLLYNTDTVIYKVLEKLVYIQNQFLDRTLMIANRSEALHFLSVKEKVFVFPCVQVTEIRKDDLLNFKFKKNNSWDKLLRRESQSRLVYGCGRETIYDFNSIEKMFAIKILTGKSYIDFRHSIPNIIFADELYVNYADLLMEIKANVKQKPLTAEITMSIENKKNDNPKMVQDLLLHTGILMTLLKKTGGDGSVPLVHYVNKWSSVLSHEFPKELLPSPDTSVKLCHIIGLNELLEEICSDTVLDALEKKYTEKLDSIAKKHLHSLLSELQMANVLLKALKRFIYRSVFTQIADADRPICDYLIDNSFWPDSSNKEKNIIKVNEMEESVQNLLPEYLMVRHVQSLTKEIEKELKMKEKDAVHMHEIARDFKKQRERRRNPPNKALAKKVRAQMFREY